MRRKNEGRKHEYPGSGQRTQNDVIKMLEISEQMTRIS